MVGFEETHVRGAQEATISATMLEGAGAGGAGAGVRMGAGVEVRGASWRGSREVVRS